MPLRIRRIVGGGGALLFSCVAGAAWATAQSPAPTAGAGGAAPIVVAPADAPSPGAAAGEASHAEGPNGAAAPHHDSTHAHDHADGHDHAHDHAHDGPSAAGPWGGGMLLPALSGPHPWSDKPVLNDPRRFQIAIMTDRTGGHRPGIWMDAVRKLNMLRPEFVMSVGDLIEGYTDDRREAENQWREFLGFIDQMDMRFFFVAGNHDVTNPLLQQMWREKFGAAWYSFDYKDVHFLCLCSEDPEQRIGEDQLNFIRADLDQHADARHTLVFLHKPLWSYAERDLAAGNPDSTNWKQVEELLGDRPHTVFAGHIHHYVQFERNGGRKYYALATTGGGSQLRGEAYGEFDHVVWLTMEPDGPQVANLKLDGILPPDVVTEQEAIRFRSFLAQTSVEVAPLLVDSEQGFTEGDLHVRLSNEFGEVVELAGAIQGLPLRGVTVDPEHVQLAVGPTGTAEHSVRIRFDQPLEFSQLAQATMIAKLRTRGDDPLLAERLIPVVIDRKHVCPAAELAPLDGDVEPWPPVSYGTDGAALVLGAADAWQGPADGSLAFYARHDDQRVVFSVRVTDERLVEGDAVELWIDPRPADQRRADPRLRRQAIQIVAPAPAAPGPVAVAADRGGRNLPRVEAVGRPASTGYDLEIAVPTALLDRVQGGAWSDFQLAAVLRDVDEPDGPAAQILWRGGRAVRESNANYAIFVKE